MFSFKQFKRAITMGFLLSTVAMLALFVACKSTNSPTAPQPWKLGASAKTVVLLS